MAIWQHSTTADGDRRVGFAFSDRFGGVSKHPYGDLNLGGHVGDDPEAVAENRRAVAAGLGFDPERVVYMNQVHGADVAYATMPWQGRAPDVDALVTDTAGLCLAVLVADCVPVLLADATAGVVAAAHAGRPGMKAGVVQATIDRMRDLGAEPGRIVAITGPSVCGLCYEVPEEMRADVSARVPAAYCETRQGTPGLDVPAGVWSQLAAAGVDIESSVRVRVCSQESPEHYSFRRDGTTGRFAGFVWLDGAAR
jgi:YfiH family protein